MHEQGIKSPDYQYNNARPYLGGLFNFEMQYGSCRLGFSRPAFGGVTVTLDEALFQQESFEQLVI